MSKPTVLVTGATGSQGGSVIEYLLKDGNFKVIALTRDPTKESAKKLELKGARIIKGDLSEKDSLIEAFKGVDALFLVTQFWEKFSKEQEIKDGQNAIDAAKQAGVKHIVFSSLDNVTKITGYSVSDFDSKATIAEYAKKQQVPLTEVQAGFYAQNFFGFFPIKKNEKGELEISYAMKENAKLEIIDITQFGGVVLEIFKNPKEWIGKKIGISEGLYSGKEIAEIVSRVTGKKAVFIPVSYEDQKKSSEDLANMFRYFGEFEGKLGNPELSKKIYPELSSLESFFKKNEELLKSL